MTNPDLIKLHPDVVKRLTELEDIEKKTGAKWTPNDYINYEAVKAAYVDEGLEIPPGKMVFFYNGKRKTEAVEWPGQQVGPDLCRWRQEEGGQGSMWIERVSNNLLQTFFS